MGSKTKHTGDKLNEKEETFKCRSSTHTYTKQFYTKGHSGKGENTCMRKS